MSARLAARAAAAAIALGGLGACVSLLPEQEVPDALYQLSAPDGIVAPAARLVIREPESPALFAGKVIASEAPDGAQRLVPGVEWSERLTRMIQVELVDSFTTGSGMSAVTDAAGARGDLLVQPRVRRFLLEGGMGRCELLASVLDPLSRDVVARVTAEGEAGADGEGNNARARALAAAGERCVTDMARQLAELAPPAR